MFLVYLNIALWTWQRHLPYVHVTVVKGIL